MQRYFFHVWDGHILVEDHEGCEFVDNGQAEMYARAAAAEMLCDFIRAQKQVGEAALKVVDQSGRPLWVTRLIDQVSQ